MLGRQARADFKKRLSIPCGQLIEDRSPGRVCQGLEDIAQPDPIIGKSLLACQEIGAQRAEARSFEVDWRRTPDQCHVSRQSRFSQKERCKHLAPAGRQGGRTGLSSQARSLYW